ncbi:MAG: EAL domain-containing protein [Bryobacterales bacterium]|nr:EAL domain-containing protein [Bryobacterales bacterium]
MATFELGLITSSAEEVLVGRQPILDRNRQIFGYELLFRSNQPASAAPFDDVAATSDVIATALLSVGFDQLVGESTAFINFNRDLLFSNLPQVLPPKRTVLEILETATVDDALVDACRKLKALGYRLALDDYVGDERFDPLLQLTDIIKVDLPGTDASRQRQIVQMCRRNGTRVLAEKVETQEDFERCFNLQYDYFQGFFFARPTIVKKRAAPANKMARMNALREANKKEINLSALEAAIRHDPTLTYQLLRYVNSAAFGFNKVESIRNALVLIGDVRIRQWVSLAIMRTFGHSKPAELMKQILVRARFCELLSVQAGQAARSVDFFLMGLFSLMDALMDSDLPEILSQVYLSDEPRLALLEDQARSTSKCIFELVRGYERSDWETVTQISERLNIASQAVMGSYVEALQWANRFEGL